MPTNAQPVGLVVAETAPVYQVATRPTAEVLAELMGLVQRLPRSAQSALLGTVRQQVANFDQLYQELSERDPR